GKGPPSLSDFLFNATQRRFAMGSQTPATEGRRQGRVLVVDDVATVRKSISMTLAHAGYEGVEAESGEQAIKLAQDVQHPFVIDVVLCDIRMTPGDGVGTMDFRMLVYATI